LNFQNVIPKTRCTKSFLVYVAEGLITSVALIGKEYVSLIFSAFVMLAPMFTTENVFFVAVESKVVTP